MTQHLFYITQAGGKYGRTVCPRCKHRIGYKFTAASGRCEGCGLTVNYTGGEVLPMDGTARPDQFRELELEL